MDCNHYYETLSLGLFQNELFSMPARSVLRPPAGFSISPEIALRGFDPETYCLQPTITQSWQWFYGIAYSLSVFLVLSLIITFSPSRSLNKLTKILEKLDFRPAIRVKCPKPGDTLTQRRNMAGGASAIVLLGVVLAGSAFYIISSMDPQQNPVPRYVRAAGSQDVLYNGENSPVVLQMSIVLVDELTANQSVYDEWTHCKSANVHQYIAFSRNSDPIPLDNRTRASIIHYDATRHENSNVTLRFPFRACILKASALLPNPSSISNTDQFLFEVMDPEKQACTTNPHQCPLKSSNSSSGVYFRLNTLSWVAFSTTNDSYVPQGSDISSVSMLDTKNTASSSIPVLKYSSAMRTSQICCRSSSSSSGGDYAGTGNERLSLVSYLKQTSAPSTIELLFGLRTHALRAFEFGSSDSADGNGDGNGQGSQGSSSNGMSRLSLSFAYTGTTTDLGAPGGSMTDLIAKLVSLIGGAIGIQLILRFFFIKVIKFLHSQQWRVGGFFSGLLGIVVGLVLPFVGQLLALTWSRSVMFSICSFFTMWLYILLISTSYFWSMAMVPPFMRDSPVSIVIVGVYILLVDILYLIAIVIEGKRLMDFVKRETAPGGCLFQKKDDDFDEVEVENDDVEEGVESSSSSAVAYRRMKSHDVQTHVHVDTHTNVPNGEEKQVYGDGVAQLLTIGQCLVEVHNRGFGEPISILYGFLISTLLPGIGIVVIQVLAPDLSWIYGSLLWVSFIFLLLGGYILFIVGRGLGVAPPFLKLAASLALLSIGLYIGLLVGAAVVGIVRERKKNRLSKSVMMANQP